MSKELYNELPRPTFRWMKVNYLELERQEAPYLPSVDIENRTVGDVTVSFYQGNGLDDLGDFAGASGESLHDALNHSMNGCSVTVPEGAKGSVRLTYNVSEAVPYLAAQLKIEAAANSEVEVYLLFEGDAKNGAVNIAEYIEAAKGAKVTVKKVQFNGEHVRHIEHRYVRSGENSDVRYVNAELGSRAVILYYKTDLDGAESKFGSRAMYIGHDEQVLDFSYWVAQKGEKSHADILATGALTDRSKKNFRGTIDFLRGCKKAVGSETDECLLLSPRVHAVSLPLLLCKEDDMEGNHASSAGQIDKDKLYYLMSRGFSEKGAQLIIVESNIRPVIDALGDAALTKRVLEAAREKMRARE